MTKTGTPSVTCFSKKAMKAAASGLSYHSVRGDDDEACVGLVPDDLRGARAPDRRIHRRVPYRALHVSQCSGTNAT